MHDDEHARLMAVFAKYNRPQTSWFARLRRWLRGGRG